MHYWERSSQWEKGSGTFRARQRVQAVREVDGIALTTGLGPVTAKLS